MTLSDKDKVRMAIFVICGMLAAIAVWVLAEIVDPSFIGRLGFVALISIGFLIFAVLLTVFEWFFK